MKILVTGANGYLGRGIVKHILDLGHEVVATDYTLDGVDNRADKKPFDLFSLDDPYNCLGRPDKLLHLAWRDGFVHYSDSHIKDLPKHYEFLTKMVEAPICEVAIMGTMHEVGFWEGCIHEDTPCNPSNPYGISKNALRLLAEMMCKQKSVSFAWLRGFYIVGNAKYGASIFSKIANAEAEGKKEFPFNSGLNQYDFLDYEDFCEQVARAVVQNDILGIINICSGQPEKLADRVERFIKENGFGIKLKYGAFPERPYDSKAIWGDANKIQQIMKE